MLMYTLMLTLYVQVVMQVVRLLPDGHRMKREVDMALDVVSETMTPMHYHLREIIICSYKQVTLCACVSELHIKNSVRWYIVLIKEETILPTVVAFFF